MLSRIILFLFIQVGTSVDYCGGTFCATLKRANCLVVRPVLGHFDQSCGLCYPNYNGTPQPNNTACTAYAAPQRPEGFSVQATLTFSGKCPPAGVLMNRLVDSILLNISLVIGVPRAVGLANKAEPCKNAAPNRYTITYEIKPKFDTSYLTPALGQQMVANMLGRTTSRLYKKLPGLTSVDNSGFKGTWKTAKVLFCEASWSKTCPPSQNLVTSLTVTVGPSSTMVFGAPIDFEANITCQNLAPNKFPSGQVRFFSAGSVIGFNSTRPGTNKVYLRVIGVPAGNHQITAAYYGDLNCRVAYQNTPVRLVVTQAPTQIQLFASPESQQSGQNIRLTFSFTYSPQLPDALRPSGVVQFLLQNDKFLRSKKINYTNNGLTLSEKLLAGLRHIYVSYTGDNNWQGKNSTVREVAICNTPIPVTPVCNDKTKTARYICCTAEGKFKNTWKCQPPNIAAC